VLVEMADSKAGQVDATRAALEAITDVPLRSYQVHSPTQKQSTSKEKE